MPDGRRFAIVLLLAAILAACSNEEELATPSESPTETATRPPTQEPGSPEPPSPTPTSAEATPSLAFEEFRQFAAEIELAVVQHDAAFFASRGVEEEMTCTGDEPIGQCADFPAGTVIRGILGAAWFSDASGLIPRDDFATGLSEWFAAAIPTQADGHGDGSARLIALAQRAEGELAAIVSLLRDTGGPLGVQRQCRVFRFVPTDGSWALRGEYFCYSTQVSEQWLSGNCAQCYDYWERWEGS